MQTRDKAAPPIGGAAFRQQLSGGWLQGGWPQGRCIKCGGMHDFRRASVTFVAVCMIFCNFFGGMHDFGSPKGPEIMHTTYFVAADF